MQKILRTAVLFVVVAYPVSAAAQTAPGWASKVKPRKALFVITTAGEQIDGKAGPVSQEGLVVLTSTGPRFVRYEGIFRAERKDSAWSRNSSRTSVDTPPAVPPPRAGDNELIWMYETNDA